jgi:hypothetical protein
LALAATPSSGARPETYLVVKSNNKLKDFSEEELFTVDATNF